MVVFTSSPVHAAQQSSEAMGRECATQWRASEAYDHCSSATVSYTTVTQGGTSTSRCEVTGSCSITVDVDDTSTTLDNIAT